MSNEVRDRLAGLGRWRWYPETGVWQHEDASEGQVQHPIPDDLTTCAAMWDEYAGRHGYRWELHNCPTMHRWEYRIWNGPHWNDGVQCSGHDAASFCRDWFRLLGEVLKARGVW